MGAQGSKLLLCSSSFEPGAVTSPVAEETETCEAVSLSCEAENAGSFGCFYCFHPATLASIRKAVERGKIRISDVSGGMQRRAELTSADVDRLVDSLSAQVTCVKMLHAAPESSHASRDFEFEVGAIRTLFSRLSPEEISDHTVLETVPLDSGATMFAFEIEARSKDVRLQSASGSLRHQPSGSGSTALPLQDVGAIRCILARRCEATLSKVYQDGTLFQKYPAANANYVFQRGMDFLRVLHSRGLVHRDVKPDNIVVGCPTQPGDPRSGIRMIDYGMLGDLESPDDTLSGTPAYIAPFMYLLEAENVGDVLSRAVAFNTHNEAVLYLWKLLETWMGEREWDARMKDPARLYVEETALRGFVIVLRKGLRGKDLLRWMWRRNDEFGLMASVVTYYLRAGVSLKDLMEGSPDTMMEWSGLKEAWVNWTLRLQAVEHLTDAPAFLPQRVRDSTPPTSGGKPARMKNTKKRTKKTRQKRTKKTSKSSRVRLSKSTSSKSNSRSKHDRRF